MTEFAKGRTLNVNLYAGPGFGKSVTAALLYAALKLRGIHTEIVAEYAKELVYCDELKGHSQHEIMKEQLRRQGLFQGKTTVVVTDSPTPMSLVYALKLGVQGDELAALYKRQQEGTLGWCNMDVLLHRKMLPNEYEQEGREQDLPGSLQMHEAITNFVRTHSPDHVELPVDLALSGLTALVLAKLSKVGIKPRFKLDAEL